MDAMAAQDFVTGWQRAWNAHDLDTLLAHFADHVTFRSPFAAQVIEGNDGVIRGKEALRAYWMEGLRRIPDLHFDIVGTYLGVDTIVIHYRNQSNGLVAEILTFDGELVVDGSAAYLAAAVPIR